MGQSDSHEYQDQKGRAVRSATSSFQQVPQAAPNPYPYPASASLPSRTVPTAGLDIERMKRAFRTWSQGTSLNKAKFNDALGLLEEFGFKSIRDTPLGNRLFDIFDNSRDGSVSEEEFVSGMSAILREDAGNKRHEYTFKAYDDTNSGFVTWKSLCDMMESSWTAAFRMLAVKAKDKNYLTSFQVETWSQSQLGRLKNMLNEEFQQLDVARMGRLDKGSFYRWAEVDHTVVAEIGQLRVEVPVSLVHIAARKIEYPTI